MITKEKFKSPERRYATSPMTHSWGEDPKALMDAYLDYGYSGAVTNVPQADGFLSNPRNFEILREWIAEMEKRDLQIWLYDENGYPSGRAGGLTLQGHPELASKGFYMHRRVSYEAKHAKFFLDDESDKIVWAAKYPMDKKDVVDFSKMKAIAFSETELECDLEPFETMYVFCVKSTHEGTHSAHNAYSKDKNINIMDAKAVRRFIDVAYEPIVQAIPDAFRRIVNVFTDEPSLHVHYTRNSESWPYALAPWVDGLFEAYEKEYGESILPQLPLLFEGNEAAYPVRVKFYHLVGKLVAEAYSGQISQWCRAHGCGFSGHYLAEERIVSHVNQYGDYLQVLRAADYPGIDVLNCYPEIYEYTTTQFAQMAVRKNNTNGMMVELCPFSNLQEFQKNPFENMMCIVGLLYLGGVRVAHSYFKADFTKWKNGYLKNAQSGHTDEEATVRFNAYVSRLGAMLDGLHNSCSLFVYYPLEDAQARTRPLHCSGWFDGPSDVDDNIKALSVPVYEHGHDFYLVDLEDLREAVRSGRENGVPQISGCAVKTILMPAMKAVYGATLEALQELRKMGVNVFFANQFPEYKVESGEAISKEALLNLCEKNDVQPFGEWKCSSIETIVKVLDEAETGAFCKQAIGGVVVKGQFQLDNGKRLHMLCNKSRTDAKISYLGRSDAECLNPEDGSITTLLAGEQLTIPAMRALFVIE